MMVTIVWYPLVFKKKIAWRAQTIMESKLFWATPVMEASETHRNSSVWIVARHLAARQGCEGFSERSQSYYAQILWLGI